MIRSRGACSPLGLLPKQIIKGPGQVSPILRNTPRLHGRVLRIGSLPRPLVEKGQQVLSRNQGFIVFLRQDNYYANSARSPLQAH